MGVGVEGRRHELWESSHGAAQGPGFTGLASSPREVCVCVCVCGWVLGVVGGGGRTGRRSNEEVGLPRWHPPRNSKRPCR